MTKRKAIKPSPPKECKQKKEDVMPLNAIQFLHWLRAKYPNRPGLKQDIDRFLRNPKDAWKEQKKKG